MARFLVFALTLLVVLSAIFHVGLEMLGFLPDLGPLDGWREGSAGLPGVFVLGTWVLEALALTTLFLLVERGGGPRWLNGLLAAWIAWVFRGPLLVLTATGFGGLAARPWWQLAFRWFVLYTLAGLLLAAIARWHLPGPRRTGSHRPRPEPGPGPGPEPRPGPRTTPGLEARVEPRPEPGREPRPEPGPPPPAPTANASPEVDASPPPPGAPSS